jgi:hypothetical protein
LEPSWNRVIGHWAFPFAVKRARELLLAVLVVKVGERVRLRKDIK